MALAYTGEGSGRISGVEKAAILLMSLSEDTAAKVMKNLEEEEILLLTRFMANMRIVPKEEVSRVLLEAKSKLRRVGIVGRGQDYVKRLLAKALGEDKTKEILSKKRNGFSIFDPSTRRIDFDSRTLVTLLKDEPPQVVALVLACMDSQKAREVLMAFPESERPKIVYKIATMDSIAPEVVHDIQETLRNKISEGRLVESERKGGVDKAAEIAKGLDKEVIEDLLDKLRDVDEALAEELDRKLLTFEDLVCLDDRSVQVLLKEIDSQTFALALKAAPEEVKNIFLRNMSKRAREMFLDDMEAMGPVRISTVEEAQQTILKTVRRLEEEGKIILSRGGKDIV
ncbi:MAG TPA: flagellar motor switch protein FliG [Thermosulfidibacter takaii]|uniref:Flagellar motor switch protein FliG n=1 Tax=Thermosulfidibacter takaii TaxID=412593 RepID=A0A7C0YCT7_9BACT|nr:flagellar motor switch protein FliG [Thermosulfidibacter takaii]